MSIFKLDSGKIISCNDCWRFQNLYETQNDHHISSYDRVLGEILPTDWYMNLYLGYSDYSGSLYNKSNQEIILEEFGDSETIRHIYGSHGYSDLLIRIDELNSNKDLQEMIFSLSDYPSLDDQNVSRLEMKAIDDSWKNTKRDFISKIEFFYGMSFFNLKDEFLRSLFDELSNNTNTNWYFEYTNAYFHVEEMLEKISLKEFLKIFNLIRKDFNNQIKI